MKLTGKTGTEKPAGHIQKRNTENSRLEGDHVQVGEDRIYQVKLGAAISYLLIFFNSIVMTPYIISSIGTDEYGVYKTVAALSSSMMVMDFGIGGTIQRYVAKYRADRREEKIPNFISMSLIIALGLNVLIILASVAILFLIDPIYGGSFSAPQIILAKKLFLLLSVNALMVVIENVFNGLITGYNKFIFGNGLKLILLIFRIIMLFALLTLFKSAVTIVVSTIMVSVITFFAEILYIKRVIKVRIKYEHWDKKGLYEAGKYTLYMFLTSIASHIFMNLDNIIIGAVCGPAIVTVYSVGLLFFSMFQNLSGGIAGVMLPTVTGVLSQRDGMAKVVNVIIKAGKAQFVLLGAALTGFICIGKDFVFVWMGEGYEDVYFITLILLIPSMFELCINVCHSILRAQNRLGFRTGVVIASAILNAILTVILVNVWSYVGAAVATACNHIVCSLIIMNLYYSKVIQLPMLQIYKSIVGRVSVCLLISGMCLFGFSRFVNGSWLAIVADIVVFCIVYGIMLLAFGLDGDDKKQIPVIRKLVK